MQRLVATSIADVLAGVLIGWITPCSVFRLRKADLEDIANSCPKILEELRQAGEERKKNTAQQMKDSNK